MSNTLVRFALIALLAFGGAACGDDDGIVHRDAGFSVLDTGNSGRLDTGARDGGTNPGDAGQSSNDSGSVQTDASTQPPTDAGPPTTSDAGDSDDAGESIDGGGDLADGGDLVPDGGLVDIDAGAPPAPIGGPARMLVGRQLICAGEVINRIDLTWAAGRLTGLTATTLGETDITWRFVWANGMPLSAEGRAGDGARHRARWTYTRDKLTTATMMGPGTQLDWRFRYNEAQQLTAASFVETVDGVQARQEGRFAHGREGPTMFMDVPIRYLGGRPATVGGERLVYRGEQLSSIPGGRITYTAGRIGRFDDGSGCIYTYRYAPQGEAEYFRDTMPFSGIGSIFGVDGRFHGELDPGRWLYLTLTLLMGE